MWRLSSTSIARSCPFSIYPARNRTIVLLSGAGFELDHGPHSRSRVASPYGRADFSGEWETHCTLADGAVEVLNAVVDAGIDYSFALCAGGESSSVTGEMHVLHALGGDTIARANGLRVELRRGDTACIVHDKELAIDIESTAQNARVALLSLGNPYAASI
jgi:environmental stress-induced protein Ves